MVQIKERSFSYDQCSIIKNQIFPQTQYFLQKVTLVEDKNRLLQMKNTVCRTRPLEFSILQSG